MRMLLTILLVSGLLLALWPACRRLLLALHLWRAHRYSWRLARIVAGRTE